MNFLPFGLFGDKRNISLSRTSLDARCKGRYKILNIKLFRKLINFNHSNVCVGGVESRGLGQILNNEDFLWIADPRIQESKDGISKAILSLVTKWRRNSVV